MFVREVDALLCRGSRQLARQVFLLKMEAVGRKPAARCAAHALRETTHCREGSGCTERHPVGIHPQFTLNCKLQSNQLGKVCQTQDLRVPQSFCVLMSERINPNQDCSSSPTTYAAMLEEDTLDQVMILWVQAPGCDQSKKIRLAQMLLQIQLAYQHDVWVSFAHSSCFNCLHNCPIQDEHSKCNSSTLDFCYHHYLEFQALWYVSSVIAGDKCCTRPA